MSSNNGSQTLKQMKWAIVHFHFDKYNTDGDFLSSKDLKLFLDN